MQNTEFLSGLIGDKYKDWQAGDKIIFDVDTSKGKSYFAINILIRYAQQQGKSLLYLCNRSDLEKRIHQRIDEGASWRGVTLMTYQGLQSVLDGAEDDPRYSIPEHDYIVADEAHYFYSDAWNGMTNETWKWLAAQDESIIIFMSATAKAFFWNTVQSQFDVAKEHIFRMSRNYNQVRNIYFYKKDITAKLIKNIRRYRPDEKTLVFLRTIKQMDEMHKLYGDKADYFCSKSQNRKYVSKNCILPDCTMRKNLLFATTALDNGTDIKDPALKNIILETFDIDTALQMIGRKRPINADDTYNLYFREPGKDTITKGIKECVGELYIADAWLTNQETFLHNPDFRRPTEHKCFYTGKCELYGGVMCAPILFNDMAYQKLQLDLTFWREVNETSYQDLLFQELGEEQRAKVEELIVFDRLASYLQDNIGRKYFKADQAELQAEFQRNGLKQGSMGINVLNRLLRQNGYKYHIESDQETSGENRKKRYWAILEGWEDAPK